MHSSLSINTLSLTLGRGTLDQHVEQVARLGARAIGPTLEEVEAVGPIRARAALRDAGLAVATLTHRAFGFATPGDAGAAQDRLDRTIALAERIGAETITFTSGGRAGLSWHEAAEAFAEAIAAPARRAREAGVRLSLEPTSPLYADASIAHRLADTVTLAAMAGIGVGIDLFACWTDADLDAAIAAAGPAIALVQVSDYVLGDRALPCRAVPGDGAIPLARLIPAIRAAGYRGRFDLEIIGPRIEAEGAEPALARAAERMAVWLDRAEGVADRISPPR